MLRAHCRMAKITIMPDVFLLMWTIVSETGGQKSGGPKGRGQHNRTLGRRDVEAGIDGRSARQHQREYLNPSTSAKMMLKIFGSWLVSDSSTTEENVPKPRLSWFGDETLPLYFQTIFPRKSCVQFYKSYLVILTFLALNSVVATQHLKLLYQT